MSGGVIGWHHLSSGGRLLAVLVNVKQFHAANARLADGERLVAVYSGGVSGEQILKFVERVARLNPSAGEIGAGMLQTIITEAQAALPALTEILARGRQA